ncbi:uncharacterized protein LOC133735441 [Rosa rugosa]|uniref:uncharacterized protein LOC133735441 n=1 Tax=Rosa rugosa TaxID=74645 RepID=UPI002B40997C|nr:uncharacterized protein LOC133735441 [Rosa rugosa]XP_062018837.1 uncharacterized protein LOC133735441 [Rosa rugosa]
MSEEAQGKQDPLKKKLRVDDEVDNLVEDAKRETRQSKARQRVDTLGARHRQVDVPEFLSDYVGDMMGLIDTKTYTVNFGTGELKGELDSLVEGAKSSLILANLKNHLIIDKMAERIRELDSQVLATNKELRVTKTQLGQKKKDVAKMEDYHKRLKEKETDVDQLGEKVKGLEKELRVKAQECKRIKGLEVEVQDLKERVEGLRSKAKVGRNSILREFQDSKEYKDILENSYSEGYTDLLNLCIEHFGEKGMEWAVSLGIDAVPLEIKGSPSKATLANASPGLALSGHEVEGLDRGGVDQANGSVLGDEPTEALSNDRHQGKSGTGDTPVEDKGGVLGDGEDGDERAKVTNADPLKC